MIRKGTSVVWQWGQGKASGKVKDIIKDNVLKQIKGSNIKRNGSKDNPVYLIEQEDGSVVIKSSSEVERGD